MDLPLTVENAVLNRYSAASKAVEPALCCPVSYDRKFLEVLPPELIERDYGCGDPSRYVRKGEVVLDLGSGGGKICYIASQIVGPAGRVIGIDMNDDMLALARKYQREIAASIGWDNVTFHQGRIQNLSQSLEEPQRTEPLIATGSIDVVLSNCVLNLVNAAERQQLFQEVYRVLRPSGRAVISDIVSNQPVPTRLKADPALWSGCISGAFEEQELLQAFSTVGFKNVELVSRQEEPWRVVEGIEFRSVTVRATKGEARCGDQETCC
jgi:arsenite methyltransferase